MIVGCCLCLSIPQQTSAELKLKRPSACTGDAAQAAKDNIKVK